jgi:methionyl-tRNA synthetase
MRYFLTTAIDYVNSRPHLGTAYEKITADVIARYHRLKGDDTWFLMGNDEHSQNVFKRAQEQGKDPLAYCDEMEQAFRDTWRGLNISYDDFIRTTDRRRHFPAVQAMAQACLDNGDIYEGLYEGHYCVGCEEFKPEKDLVDGLCPIHKTKPEWIREKNWFFRLSKYQQPLLDLYARQPSFIEPETRRNEILRLVEGGLEDISMSRAGQSWGVPLPFDPASVVYVWFDALINYAAAVGYGWDQARFATDWPASLHIVGKDITRFHCVFWPAMLMSAKLPLPGQVFGHGWVFFKGERMSKSLGNIVDPLDAAKRFGPDPLRLYLTKEVPYGADGDFTWERFEEKYNADLANNLGNLVNRVASMTERYRQGRLPASAPRGSALPGLAESAVTSYREAMDRHALHEAVAAAFRLVSATNEFVASSQPWALAKDPARETDLSGVLYDAAEAVRVAAVLLQPIMPDSAAEILRRVGDLTAPEARRLSDAAWRSGEARQISNSGALWPRIEDKGATVVSETPTPNPVPTAAPVTASATSPAPAAPAAASPAGDGQIAIDDFMKVELRTAKILTAERLPKSKKLLKLSVDAGEAAPRTILAGIAESYEPEAIVGRSIVIVANLKPREMMGTVSQGMVLAASTDNGPAMLVNPDPAPPGTRVR